MKGIDFMRFSTKEKERIINNYMKKLDISYDEAIDLFAYDFEGAENCEATCLEEKSKTMSRRYEREVKPDSEKKSRPRKPDATKAEIINTAESALTEFASNISVVPEKTIDFTYNSVSYNLKLTKHNTYKGIAEPKTAKRKVNADKEYILNTIVAKLYCADYEVTDILVQTETKINFNINSTNYTLALTAHRK